MARIDQLRVQIGDVMARDERRAASRQAPAAPHTLPWPAVATPHGPLHCVERWLEPDHHHGAGRVGAGHARAAATLAILALDPALAALDTSRLLFLDTETTGLSGGTGTVAFLVGLAWFEQGVLRLSQLVVPNLGAEAPVLARLTEQLREASCIVTYNGKSFDWPLLRTRFVLNRMPAPHLPAHIDLLHVARRVWRQRLQSVRLSEIERDVLRLTREDDVGGAEIPARYFAFLRDGDASRLRAVLEHNQNDLIALAAILGRLADLVEQRRACDDAPDLLALATLCARAGDDPRALRFAERVLERDHRIGPAHELRSRLLQRSGDARSAAQALTAALAHARDEAGIAALHLSLAKVYEHALRDFGAAYRHARHTLCVEGPHAHGRRLGRLHRRMWHARGALA